MKRMRLNSWLALALFVQGALLSVKAQSLTETNLSRITFDQNLRAQVSLDLSFRDESGRAVRLGEYFGKKPVVLVLGYYGCPMLCTLTLNGMIEAMGEMKWRIGDQFEVINVSIDPTEESTLAAAKKRTYLKRYGRAGAEAGWHFLTGEAAASKRLADEVGFHYAYDSSVKQYAHPSGLVILTPDGKVSKYLFGVTFSPTELFAAIEGASARKVGSPIQRLVLLCFHYSPIQGKYGAAILLAVRILAASTMAGAIWLFIALRRREHKRPGILQ